MSHDLYYRLETDGRRWWVAIAVVVSLAFALFSVAVAQSPHQIVVNIVKAGGPYKPYSPFPYASGASSRAYGYDLARLGSSVVVSFDKIAPVEWVLSIETPKVTISDVSGTNSNRFVRGTSFVSYYQVMDGALRGACIMYLKDKSLINVFSKVRAETRERSTCR